MAIKSRGKPQVEEDAESRALRRMQAFDQSDSDLDHGASDNSEQSESEEDESEDQDESESEEQSEDDDEDQSEEDDEDEEEESSDSDDSDEDSDASDDDSDDSDSDADGKKLRELQKNLSQIPFDKLAEIQQKVGMKVFHQTIRGSEKKKVVTKGVQRSSRVARDDDDSDEDEDESDEDESGEEDRNPKNKMDKLRNAMNKDKKERRIIEKRADKNRPMEIGSKKPVGRFRQVVEVPTAKRRDPRFDSLSGKLDTDLFEKSYSFLKDYQADEMQKLKELIKKERDPDMKEKLQTQLSRMVDRQATEAAQKRRQEIKREHKRKEKELIAKGKNPFFLKKADQKKLELINKFQHLKENPKALARAMEKRRKRNAAKEKTKVLGGKRRRVD